MMGPGGCRLRVWRSMPVLQPLMNRSDCLSPPVYHVGGRLAPVTDFTFQWPVYRKCAEGRRQV